MSVCYYQYFFLFQIDKMCSHLPVYFKAVFDLNYKIEFPDNSTDMEILQVGLLSLWVKNVENFTETNEVEINVDKMSLIIEVHGRSTILKRTFGHEIRNIKQSINEQKISVIEKHNPSRIFQTTNKQFNSQLSNVTTIFHTHDFSVDSMQKFLPSNDIITHEIYIYNICSDLEIIVSREDTDLLNVTYLNCKPNSLKQTKVSVLSILSYIFSSISILSLLVLITINRRHHFHVEIPFSNLENIAVSMILANILFMVGTVAKKAYDYNWICYGMSIALHYSWLTVFSFTTLAVFQIVRILLKLKARSAGSHQHNARKRRLLTCTGLVVPLLFVAPALYIDKNGPSRFSPGYGKSVCFPTQFPGNLIFFTGPVMMSIAMNTVCLVQIIVKIHSVEMSKWNMHRSTTFSEAKIFLRILVLSGCFWLTGILASYFESEWLEYVFTILCGSQGLFVAIANLTTSRVQCCKCSLNTSSHDVSTMSGMRL